MKPARDAAPQQALMVMGTGSGVGKSFIATGLCRLLARRGYRVAPFKAQNMSNNAAPAEGGGDEAEIGRAQATQAEAAGLRPHVDMNPVLLKPTGDQRAQVVLLGRSVGHLSAAAYRAQHARWWNVVSSAYARLAAANDVVVIEGAGSPAEFNLRDTDIVNMAVALHTRANVLLVGDIDRGGVFASLLGTMALLAPDEAARVAGFVINRFRGDASLLAPAFAPFTARTHVPVRGVVPYRADILVDDEDSQGLVDADHVRPSALDIAVVRVPTIANFTDVQQLAVMPGVAVRYVTRAEQLGNPDLVIVPGAKDTFAALDFVQTSGVSGALHAAVRRQIPVLGLCGGYQLLGDELVDEHGHGGSTGTRRGLGLLPVSTRFGEIKRTRDVRGVTRGSWLFPPGLAVAGYEIHQGRTHGGEPLLSIARRPEGAVNGLVAGTYVHGLLDAEPVRAALVDALWRRRGVAPPRGAPEALTRLAHYDAIADLLEAEVDLSGLLPPRPQPGSPGSRNGSRS
ncbi:MAG: cobyric acid synthase [Sandaracinaceae bacterium]|nr:cobyric acid synthase [Myxococcales bacterium]MCB9658484.1 cobyric acid synthase [Sandaracinaceae bacterium]